MIDEDGKEISFYPSRIYRVAGGEWKVSGRKAKKGGPKWEPDDTSISLRLTPQNRQKIETKYEFKIDDIAEPDNNSESDNKSTKEEPKKQSNKAKFDPE